MLSIKYLSILAHHYFRLKFSKVFPFFCPSQCFLLWMSTRNVIWIWFKMVANSLPSELIIMPLLSGRPYNCDQMCLISTYSHAVTDLRYFMNATWKWKRKKKQPKQNIKQREANNSNKTHYHQKINQLDYYDAQTRNVGKNAIFTTFSLSSSQCNGRKECLCVNRYEQKNQIQAPRYELAENRLKNKLKQTSCIQHTGRRI